MMKRFYITLLLLTLCMHSYSQKQTTEKSSAISSPIFVSIGKKKAPPPYLEIVDCHFIDSDGNMKIDANEQAYIKFNLVNSGMGVGKGLDVRLDEQNNIPGLSFEKSLKISDIQPSDTAGLTIPIRGSVSLTKGVANFSLLVSEPNGFNSDVFYIEVETEPFKEPKILVTDYLVSSQVGSTIEKRKPFHLQILVQNIGLGLANDVSLKMQFPMNVFCISSNENVHIGNLAPGEKRIIDFSLVTNAEFELPSINLDFYLTERYGQYSENRNIGIALNQKVTDQRLIVEGINNDRQSDIDIGYLQSDVDRNIPETTIVRENKIALIIGNENYIGFDSEVNVDFAKRDAEVFKNYAIKTFGLLEKNVFLITDATSANMLRNIDLVTELVKRMGPNTELIFFYAGHGYPEPETQNPLIIPVDVNTTNLTSAIPLKDIYKKFAETNAKKITVIIDACFSGGGRNKGLLAARAVRIKPKEEAVSGNMIVLTASTGDQTALPYGTQKHGLFTYFLLKKLQETKGEASFGEIFDYLKERIGIESLRSLGKPQDPSVFFSPNLYDTWNKLSF